MNKLKLLVVDDSVTMIRIISNTLQKIGVVNIDTAEDGEIASELFKNNEYNMVLSDINMPNMDGYGLLESIRSISKDVPIVMITTEGSKADVVKALKLGASSYIIKPFTPQVLKEKLLDIFSK